MFRELEIKSTMFLNFGVYFALAGCYYRSYYNRYYCSYNYYDYNYYYIGGGAIAGIVIGVLSAIGLLISVFICICLKKCKGIHWGTRSGFRWRVSNVNTSVIHHSTVRQTRLFHQQPYAATTLNYTVAPAQAYNQIQYGVLPPNNAPTAYSATYTAPPPPINATTAYSATYNAPPPAYSSVLSTNAPVGKS